MRIRSRADVQREEVERRVRRLLDSAETVGIASVSPETRQPEVNLDEVHPAEVTSEIPASTGPALRVAPSLASAVSFGAVALIVAVLCIWWVLRARSHSTEIHGRSITTAAASSPASVSSPPSASSPPSVGPSLAAGSASASATLVVDVVGHVTHPGVYRLPAGSRVTDAIAAAGGALAGMDLSSLNLAQRISDGQQIAVGVAGASAAGGGVSGSGVSGSGGAASGAASSGGLVNLNTASAEQLDALPGVGPVLAQNIVAWRSAHGRFENVEQLRQVSGIGPAKFATLKSAVTV